MSELDYVYETFIKAPPEKVWEVRVSTGFELDRIEVDYIGSTSPTINYVRVTSSADGHVRALFERTLFERALLARTTRSKSFRHQENEKRQMDSS